MKTSKFYHCLLVAMLSLGVFTINLPAQIFENNKTVRFFNDKTILGLNFVDSDLWVSTQRGIFRYNQFNDSVNHYSVTTEKSNPLSDYRDEKTNVIEIQNILSNGKTAIFCNYLNDKLLKLENDSTEYIDLHSYLNTNGLISSLNIYNNEIWFVVGKGIYPPNNRTNIYYLMNNHLYEYENPYGSLNLEDLIFYVTDSMKYFIGVEFNNDNKIYKTRLIVKSNEKTIINSVIDTNCQRVDYKSFSDSRRIYLLDDVGKLIKIEENIVEIIPLDFNYYSKKLFGNNRDYYWFTANKDIVYISNTNGLFVYDTGNKTLIKKIEYPESIVLENIIFKDNKIWGSLGPVTTDDYRAYSLGIIDLLK